MIVCYLGRLKLMNTLKHLLIIFRKFGIIVGRSNKFKGNFTQSIELHFDCLSICVTTANLIPPWRSAFLVASPLVYLIYFIGLYVFAATVFVFYKYYHHPENFFYCCGAAFYSSLGVSIPYYPTHGLARIATFFH